jgi:hypothetical protein
MFNKAMVEYKGLFGLTLRMDLETGKTEIYLDGILKWMREKTMSEIMQAQKDLYVTDEENKEFVVTEVIAYLLDGETITA